MKERAAKLTKNIRFLGVFFLIFFLSASFLFVIDFVPEQPENNLAAVAETEISKNENSNDAENQTAYFSEIPTRIQIPKVGVDTIINNPTSAIIEVLDKALLSGSVRYPGSSLLGENSPMFLFGHQSQLPVVRNPAFKAFNNLQKLNNGDVIRISSDTAVYEYAVEKVSLVEAEEALIPLTAGDKTLYLSTCNSFGDPGERYVVKASFVQRISN